MWSILNVFFSLNENEKKSFQNVMLYKCALVIDGVWMCSSNKKKKRKSSYARFIHLWFYIHFLLHKKITQSQFLIGKFDSKFFFLLNSDYLVIQQQQQNILKLILRANSFFCVHFFTSEFSMFLSGFFFVV